MGVHIVRSFQDCRLFPDLSVEDTLLLCEDARHEVGVVSTTLQLPWARRREREKRGRVDAVIGSFGLEVFRHHRTAQLSTGTRRVVDLATIVLAEPRLLLLDEPTAGIAQREAEAFVPLLRRLHEVADTTIVLVGARRPPRHGPLLDRRGHGDRQGGRHRYPGRGQSRSRGRSPPTSGPARKPPVTGPAGNVTGPAGNVTGPACA